MLKRFLRDMVIVQVDVAFQRLLQLLAATKTMGCQYLRNAPIETFYHAVSRRMPRFDESVVYG